MSYKSYHPVYLALEGRPVLIVGGGTVAVEKLHSLLPSGASITVVSPEVSEEILRWHGEEKLFWIRREFLASDIDDAFAVIAATDDPALNARIFELGEAQLKLTNSVDDPEHCNFIMAAIAKSGPMQVAISSAGCSPALAQRVRNRIEREILTEDVGRLAEYLGAWRSGVKAALPTYKARQAFWERVIDSAVPHLLAGGRRVEADELFLSMLNGASVSSPVRNEHCDYTPARASDVLDPRKVYIVGAGPGDPGLITVRAAEILRRADVILYDRLVNPILLGYAPPSAECIYVGKEKGSPGQSRQDAIHAKLIQYARRGRLVVRLKGGDPFVFGRGGEEALALAEAGIDFEVVPGVSSAVAGPAAARIPVTHRGVSTGFAVFTGMEADGSVDHVPWAAAAQMPTAVFLMGVEALPRIAEKLLANGRDGATPAAVVSHATLSEQRVVVGSLASIAEDARELTSPAIVVVGEVVRIREELDRLSATVAGAPESMCEAA